MAKELRVVIDVDDKFTKQSLKNLQNLRTQAQASVNNQRRQLHQNWMDWAKGIADLKASGFKGFGGPGGGGGGGGGGSRRGRAPLRRKNPMLVAARRAKRLQRANNTPGKMALNAAKASAVRLGRALPGGVTAALAGAAGLAARAAPPLAIGYAAYKMAQTASEGLVVLGGAINALSGSMGSSVGSTLTGISENIGEAVFDQPSKWAASVQRTTSIAMAFNKARVPLSPEALLGVAEFVGEEAGWKKQRERREREEMGEALGIVIKQVTGFGGG
jgi:hypothetical protein